MRQYVCLCVEGAQFGLLFCLSSVSPCCSLEPGLTVCQQAKWSQSSFRTAINHKLGFVCYVQIFIILLSVFYGERY